MNCIAELVPCWHELCIIGRKFISGSTCSFDFIFSHVSTKLIPISRSFFIFLPEVVVLPLRFVSFVSFMAILQMWCRIHQSVGGQSDSCVSLTIFNYTVTTIWLWIVGLTLCPCERFSCIIDEFHEKRLLEEFEAVWRMTTLSIWSICKCCLLNSCVKWIIIGA